MINWDKYVDKIIYLNYNQTDILKNLFIEELNRVGITSYQEENYNNNFLEKDYINFLDYELKDKINLNIPKIIEQVIAIKKAYYEGANKVLILEDNIRFLKDLNKIEQILDNIPSEEYWDIIFFNTSNINEIQYYNLIKDKKSLINKYYCKFYNFVAYNCYILNRNAMKFIINSYQCNIYQQLTQKIQTNIYFPYLKRIFSLTNLAVNVTNFNKENILTKEQKINIALKEQQNYKNIELDFNKYNIGKDGSPYQYGDYIEE